MYESIAVYRRLGPSEVVVYRCFKEITTGRYSVQSADRIRFPVSYEDLRQHEVQFLELLSESDPVDRAGEFSTLEEAIADFDADFDE